MNIQHGLVSVRGFLHFASNTGGFSLYYLFGVRLCGLKMKVSPTDPTYIILFSYYMYHLVSFYSISCNLYFFTFLTTPLIVDSTVHIMLRTAFLVWIRYF